MFFMTGIQEHLKHFCVEKTGVEEVSNKNQCPRAWDKVGVAPVTENVLNQKKSALD